VVARKVFHLLGGADDAGGASSPCCRGDRVDVLTRT